ncbi:MAG: hypothetical protein HWD61_03485 [Parachlamydiaceae bacterium]|nr:MAG: hypothetical protein HWD61_03485 [Parachlamydiaceae bacterium]
MMNLKLLTLVSAGLFLIAAPILHLQGVDTANPQKVNVVIQNDDEITKEIKNKSMRIKILHKMPPKLRFKQKKAKSL